MAAAVRGRVEAALSRVDPRAEAGAVAGHSRAEAAAFRDRVLWGEATAAAATVAVDSMEAEAGFTVASASIRIRAMATTAATAIRITTTPTITLRTPTGTRGRTTMRHE